MIAKLYSNENFPLPVVEKLRAWGHAVLTSQEAGNSHLGIPDDEVLAYASKLGRAVITHNRQDFIRLHRTNPDHEGIVVCTENSDFAALASKVKVTLEAFSSLTGQLVRVNRGPSC